MPSSLLLELRAVLKRVANPAKAPQMQAYMKSKLPYLGIQAPLLSRTCKLFFAAHPLNSAAAWRKAVLEIWRSAQFREERYAAIELTGAKRYAAFQTLQTLPMYEELVVTGAWWDYVDVIASRRLGPLLKRYPTSMRRKMISWSRSKDIWKKRSAILCQLSFKADTDLELLYRLIEPSLNSKEFFLRKAIGWALRQYAWTNPREVYRCVKEHRSVLSPLTKREALKNVLASGLIGSIP